MKADKVIGLILIAFSIFMYIQADRLPPALFGTLGAGFVPKNSFRNSGRMWYRARLRLEGLSATPMEPLTPFAKDLPVGDFPEQDVPKLEIRPVAYLQIVVTKRGQEHRQIFSYLRVDDRQELRIEGALHDRRGLEQGPRPGGTDGGEDRIRRGGHQRHREVRSASALRRREEIRGRKRAFALRTAGVREHQEHRGE